MNYARHMVARQTEQAESNQVLNSAGGYVFQLDCWKALDRWLILGAEGGTYYASERKLTRDNAATITACLKADGRRTVEQIAQISESGRAPKNDPAIFALALAASFNDAATRAAALAAVPRVCRIGTHLFHFAAAVNEMRGWGRGLKRAVGNWYTGRDAESLLYQLTKYQQRDGWSHRDLLRLSHPTAQSSDISAALRWAVAGADGFEPRIVGRPGEQQRYYTGGKLPAYLAAFEELKTADARRTIALIQEHSFTHEMVRSDLKQNPEVWEALLAKMPIGAMVRNLGKMTQIDLLRPFSIAAGVVASRLSNAELVKKARLHPIALLSALRVYQQGHGERGSLTWQPVPAICDALEAAFYFAFDAVEPIGKPVMLALDVSGSMAMSTIAGVPGLTPRVASAAMAMVTARREANYLVFGFSDRFVHLPITAHMSLAEVERVISGLPFARTDCSLPMLFAERQKLGVQAFQVYTDSETFFGNVHPHIALKSFRRASGNPATLAVVGMAATGFSIANPADPGQLDVVGFDTAAPALMASFARGWQ